MPAKQGIHAAAHRSPAPLQDMGVDLRGRHVPMPHQLLDGADVVPCLQQVRRKAVARVCGVARLAIPVRRTAERIAF